MYFSKHSLLPLLIGVAAADVDSKSSSSSSPSLHGRLARFLRGNSLTKESLPDTIANTIAIANNDETYNDASSPLTSRKLAVGCYGTTYVSGTSYGPGSFVSVKVSSAQIASYPNWIRDPVTGGWIADVDTKPVRFAYYNYKCNDDTIWCGSAGYGPNEAGESLAWTKLDECDPNLAPPKEECPLWPKVGCPIPFDNAKDKYDGGEIVAHEGRVYQCAAAPQNVFCSMEGYEPDKWTHISTVWVWEIIGCCKGTLAPTPSPAGDWEDLGGCFCEYDAKETYVAGDKITQRKYGSQIIYQCKGAPMDQFCSMPGYEPGTDELPQYWREAWTIIGTCDGTSAPTPSPNMVNSALIKWPGCPPEWKLSLSSDPSTEYEAGDAISLNGLVYTCKQWPYSGHCGQTGYMPKEDPATPGAWKIAWTLVGYCFGTMAPTMAPQFDELSIFGGGCPDKWDANKSYEEDDLVSVVVSEMHNKLADTTKRPTSKPTPQPTSQKCYSSRSPKNPTSPPTKYPTSKPSTGPSDVPSLEPSHGPSDVPSLRPSQGPSDVPSLLPSQGPSDVPSLKPSQSPSNVPSLKPSQSPSNVPSLKPSQSPSNVPSVPPPPPPAPLNNELRSLVEVDDGLRSIVYKCKEWPNTLYCSQNDPTQYDGRGWTAVGYCHGSQTPTGSPIRYDGTCQFKKCVVVPNGGDPEPCTTGQEGCTCNGSSTCTRRPDVEVCSLKDAEPFSSSVEYVEDDVVRLGTKRFKCKGWPYSGWCKQAVYAPSLKPGYWSMAWEDDGECTYSRSQSPSDVLSLKPSQGPSASLKPSQGPSDVPSMKPSQSPSDVPSLKPSQGPSDMPSQKPSQSPSDVPSLKPSQGPSDVPSLRPSQGPSDVPSLKPSQGPSDVPSLRPSQGPSNVPSLKPSQSPSNVPSLKPSQSPSNVPSVPPPPPPAPLNNAP